MKTLEQKTSNKKKQQSGFFSKQSIPIIDSEKSNEKSANKNTRLKKRKPVKKNSIKPKSQRITQNADDSKTKDRKRSKTPTKKIVTSQKKGFQTSKSREIVSSRRIPQSRSRDFAMTSQRKLKEKSTGFKPHKVVTKKVVKKKKPKSTINIPLKGQETSNRKKLVRRATMTGKKRDKVKEKRTVGKSVVRKIDKKKEKSVNKKSKSVRMVKKKQSSQKKNIIVKKQDSKNQIKEEQIQDYAKQFKNIIDNLQQFDEKFQQIKNSQSNLSLQLDVLKKKQEENSLQLVKSLIEDIMKLVDIQISSNKEAQFKQKKQLEHIQQHEKNEKSSNTSDKQTDVQQIQQKDHQQIDMQQESQTTQQQDNKQTDTYQEEQKQQLETSKQTVEKFSTLNQQKIMKKDYYNDQNQKINYYNEMNTIQGLDSNQKNNSGSGNNNDYPSFMNKNQISMIQPIDEQNVTNENLFNDKTDISILQNFVNEQNNEQQKQKEQMLEQQKKENNKQVKYLGSSKSTSQYDKVFQFQKRRKNESFAFNQEVAKPNDNKFQQFLMNMTGESFANSLKLELKYYFLELLKKMLVYSSKIEDLQEKIFSKNENFDLLGIFNIYDIDNSGFISQAEMLRLIQDLGFEVTTNSFKRFIFYIKEILMSKKADNLSLNFFQFAKIFYPFQRDISRVFEKYYYQKEKENLVITEEEFELMANILAFQFKKLDEIQEIIAKINESQITTMFEFIQPTHFQFTSNDMINFLQKNGVMFLKNDIDLVFRDFGVSKKGVMQFDEFKKFFTLNMWFFNQIVSQNLQKIFTLYIIFWQFNQYMLLKLNKFAFCCHSQLPKLNGYIMYCAPGAGKNDFVQLFKDEYNLAVVSPGSFQSGKEAKNALNDTLKRTEIEMNDKEIVDNKAVVQLLKKINSEDGQKQILLEGLPRNQAQIDTIIKSFDISQMRVINIYMEDEILVRLLSGKRTCDNCDEQYNVTQISEKQYDIPAIRPEHKGQCNKCNSRLVRVVTDNIDLLFNRIKLYKVETEQVLDILKNQIGLKVYKFDAFLGRRHFTLMKKELKDHNSN